MQTTFINSGQLSPPEPARRQAKRSTIGLALGAALLVTLAGCVGHADGRRHAVYAEPSPVYVRGEISLHHDYVYYPRYQVYYSSSQRHYMYQDGRSWVTRPQPPRVSVEVLLASPSVQLDFHDSPSIHHARVVRQYPKHWSPPGDRNHPRRGDRDEDWNHGGRNDRGGRR